MWRRMRVRGHTQGLMRDIFAVLAHQSSKFVGFTMENMVGGPTSGPFPPMAPESAALVLLVMEYVWMHRLSTPASRAKYGLKGCAAADACFILRPFGADAARRAHAGRRRWTRTRAWLRWRRT